MQFHACCKTVNIVPACPKIGIFERSKIVQGKKGR